MKNIFIAALMLFGCLTYAQSGGSGFGLKAGLNFSGTGDLKINEVPDISSDAKLGYHVGVWGRFGGRAYVRPELVFTQVNSSYDGDGSNRDFKMQKLDLPVLFGHRFLKIFHGFIGPAFQYVLKTDLENIDISDVENEFTVGFQIGGGLNLGNFGIDLRFERGFSPNYVDLIEENIEGVRLDTRPTQWILGLSYKF